MKLNKHFGLEGKHAFLSPSSYHWIRYDDDKLVNKFVKSVAARRGTELHQLAHDLIRLNVKLPANGKTLNMYVNHVIGFRMTPEQRLFYSNNCFGTADALGFRKMQLKIYDLKTGEIEASGDQLEVYAAIFCLEYGFKPFDLTYDLRIYQNDEIAYYDVNPATITEIMDKIVTFDRRIEELRAEVED